MITQNFINFMTLVGTASINNERKYIRKIDGSSATIHRDHRIYLSSVANNKNQSYANSMLNENTSVNSDICVFGFGTGDTIPTVEDFSLEKAIVDPVFKYQISGYKLNNTEQQVQQVLTATYKYTGADTISISEIGLFVKLKGTEDSKYYPFMIARDVLANPITVSNNDIFTVTMTLS